MRNKSRTALGRLVRSYADDKEEVKGLKGREHTMKSTRLGPTIISPGTSTQISLLPQQTNSSACC